MRGVIMGKSSSRTDETGDPDPPGVPPGAPQGPPLVAPTVAPIIPPLKPRPMMQPSTSWLFQHGGLHQIYSILNALRLFFLSTTFPPFPPFSLVKIDTQTKIPKMSESSILSLGPQVRDSATEDNNHNNFTSEEWEKLSRQSKHRRARFACLACRSRKVRCDVTERFPCGKCAWSDAECITQRRRRPKLPNL